VIVIQTVENEYTRPWVVNNCSCGCEPILVIDQDDVSWVECVSCGERSLKSTGYDRVGKMALELWNSGERHEGKK
jgi:hypothetical protein